MAKSDLIAKKPELPIGASDIVQGVLDLAGCIPEVGDAAQASISKAIGSTADVFLKYMPKLVPLICQLPDMMEQLKGLMENENPKLPKQAAQKAKHMKAFAQMPKGKVKTGAKTDKDSTSRKEQISQEKTKGKAASTNGKCFTGDTLVLTKSGLCPIKQIQKGDDIYSRNEYTRETGFRKVEEVFQTEAYTIYHIWLNGGQEVKTTAYHSFFVKERGWVTAIKLREDDVIETMEGAVSITSITKVRQEEPVIVYNFHVEEWSSYFVTENKIYVHNSEDEHVEKQYRVSPDRREHILEGESATDPGHGPNRGFERSAFPDGMTDDEAISIVEDVANSPDAVWLRDRGPGPKRPHIGGPAPDEPKFTRSGLPVQYQVTERRGGLDMFVVVEPGGRGIITGFPPSD